MIMIIIIVVVVVVDGGGGVVVDINTIKIYMKVYKCVII